MTLPNPQQKADELESILEKTIVSLGGTNQSYNELLKYLSQQRVLRVPNVFLPGQMVFFKYKPQDTRFVFSGSPYDLFPLVIITDVHRDGFEGINIHFLSKRWRKELFEAIEQSLPKRISGDPSLTRLGATYARLDGARKFKFFRPCYRRYVKGGFRKRPILIPSEFWNVMVDLDLALFVNGNKQYVRRKSYNSAIRSENTP